jgi:hypothetical protein
MNFHGKAAIAVRRSLRVYSKEKMAGRLHLESPGIADWNRFSLRLEAGD